MGFFKKLSKLFNCCRANDSETYQNDTSSRPSGNRNQNFTSLPVPPRCNNHVAQNRHFNFENLDSTIFINDSISYGDDESTTIISNKSTISYGDDNKTSNLLDFNHLSLTNTNTKIIASQFQAKNNRF